MCIRDSAEIDQRIAGGSGDDREGADRRDRLDRRVEGAAGAPHEDVGIAQGVCRLGEPARLLVLAAHRLDDQSRLEALMGDLRDLGAQLLGAGD